MAHEFESRRDGSLNAEAVGRRRTAWMPALAVVAGVALQLPSLGMGFYGDDWIRQIVLRGDSPAAIPLRPWNLFDFGTAADWSEVASQSGWTPIWWISPDWQIRFARLVASLSIWADHVVWGPAAAGYHATSIAWCSVLLVLVLAVYRALSLGPAGSCLATAAVEGRSGHRWP